MVLQRGPGGLGFGPSVPGPKAPSLACRAPGLLDSGLRTRTNRTLGNGRPGSCYTIWARPKGHFVSFCSQTDLKHPTVRDTILDASLCRAARQFLGSLPAIVRYDDSSQQRVQLESLISVSGGLSHELHSVVDDRRFPRRTIRLRSAAAKGDTGQPDDVGVVRGEREELRTVATDRIRR